MAATGGEKKYQVTWLRPEYEGRESELLIRSTIADLARVAPYTVTSWVDRYDNFPKPVKEVRTGPAPQRYYVIGEIIDWLLHHRPGDRDGEADQLAIVLATYEAEQRRRRDELAHLDHIVDGLRAALNQDDTISQ